MRQVPELEEAILQRPVVRQAQRQAAAFAAADGPILRRAAQVLLAAGYPSNNVGATEGAIIADNSALVPLEAEVCVEVNRGITRNPSSGRTPCPAQFGNKFVIK